MTILSYLSNLAVPHNYIHNTIFLIIGLLGFFFTIEKKIIQKKIKTSSNNFIIIIHWNFNVQNT